MTVTKYHKRVFRDSIKSLGLLTIHNLACFSARINYDKITKDENTCHKQHVNTLVPSTWNILVP